MELFSSPDCASAQRVRIALRLKRIPYVNRPMAALQEELGETQLFSLGVAPGSRGPVLMDQQRVLTQSLAIIEYLDELYQHPLLIPVSARDRARVHAMAEVVANEAQSLTEPPVLDYLRKKGAFDEVRVQGWNHHWLGRGLNHLERMLRGNPATGRYCHGDSPTFADLFLVPLVAAAEAQGLDLTPYPTVAAIYRQCLTLPAFADPA